tara:strand:- start:7621 stop:7830 length:210 start_codon:yes stop_codon:yes gene_type:complete
MAGACCDKCASRARPNYGAKEMQSFYGEFQDWLSDPFDGDMDALGWFLMIGLVLASLFAWSTIINKIAE